MVDAAGGLDTLDWSAEARKQAILADRLVVSKTDLAGAQAADRLIARLRSLNPRAAIHTAIDGDLDPRCLVEPDAAAPAAGDAHSGFIAEAEHSDGITSFVITDDAPLPWDAFARSMDTLIALRGARPAAGEGLPQRRGLPRPGGGAVRAAPRPSAGRACGLAGRGPREPACVHHAEHFRAAGA